MTARIWSVWDMLEKYALLFSDALTSLKTAQEAWKHKPPPKLPPPSMTGGNALTVGNIFNSSLINPAPPPSLPKVEDEDSEFWKNLRASLTNTALKSVRTAVEAAGMTRLLPQIGRIEGKVGKIWENDLEPDLRNLGEAIRDELKGAYFLHVQAADIGLYGQPAGFGEKVSERFTEATDDIEAAGNCLAVGEATASVFHLMRVMELGVRALARCLKVRAIDPETANWNVIVDHVNVAINKLPTRTKAMKARKAELAGASAALNSVRIATRNEVMHPKQMYTMEQARDVFQATRLFMRHLADLV
jgi:hypothetical protein